MRVPTILGVVVFLVSALVLSGQERTWTDIGGKFRVEATLLDFDGKEVKLKKKDGGAVLDIPLKKLSLPDQLYVKRLMSTLGDAVQTPKPDTPETAPPPEKQAPPDPMWNEDDNETKAFDSQLTNGTFPEKIYPVLLDHAEEMALAKVPDSRSSEPDPSPVENLDFRPKPLYFTFDEVDFHTRVANQGLFFCDQSPEKVLTAVTFSKTSFEANESGTRDFLKTNSTKVFLGNLKSGRFRSQTWPETLHSCGLSPDGKRVFFIREQIVDHKNKTLSGAQETIRSLLAFVDTTREDFSCIGVLRPFADETVFRPSHWPDDRRKSWQDIKFAAWVDNEHVLAISNFGQMMLFNVRSREAVWYFAKSSPLLAFSPGKKYLLLHREQPYLLETRTGKVVGQFQWPKEVVDQDEILFSYSSRWRFAFSPGGTRLAACTEEYICFWDTKNGDCAKPLYFDKHFSKPYWLDETYLICGRTLIDSKQLLPVWVYDDAGLEDSVFAGLYWHLVERSHAKDDRPGYILTSYKLPHAALPPLPPLSDAQKYCVRPGVAVRLQVDPEVPDSQKVLEYVTKLAEGNGLVIFENAPLVLAARFKWNEPQADAPNNNPVNIVDTAAKPDRTTFTYSYSFEQDGKTYWETADGWEWDVRRLHEKGGRAFQAFQENPTEERKPSSEWYLQVKIPKFIPFDKAGHSTLTGR